MVWIAGEQIISEEEFNADCEKMREELLGFVSKNSGYSLNLMEINQDLSSKNIEDVGVELEDPTILKDKNGEIYIYGNNENNVLTLTRLEKLPISKLFKENVNYQYPVFVHYKDIPPEIYESINSQKGHIQSFHFSDFPKEIAEDVTKTQATLKSMYSFLNSDKYKEYVKDFLTLAINFTQKDLDSMGTSEETDIIKKFRSLWRLLESNGFFGTRGERINFWSGEEAKYYADSQTSEISNLKVPIMSVMYFMLDELKKYKFKNFLSEAISKMYAYNATADVNVYIAPENRTDKIMLIHNHFWNAEIYVLQQKLQKGEINSISISFYDETAGRWEKPINFNSQEANELLFLMRREYYLPNLKQLKKDNPVLAAKMKKELVEKGENAEARKPYPLNSMRLVVKHYKNKLEHHALQKERIKNISNPVRLQKHMLNLWKTPVRAKKSDLEKAFITKDVEKIKVLTNSHTVNEEFTDGMTPLCLAAKNNDVEMIKFLLSCQDIDVNKPSAGGYSPLMLAAHKGHFPAVEALLASPDIQIEQENLQSERARDLVRKTNPKIAEKITKILDAESDRRLLTSKAEDVDPEILNRPKT